jgi:hypothetical protein
VCVCVYIYTHICPLSLPPPPRPALLHDVREIKIYTDRDVCVCVY